MPHAAAQSRTNRQPAVQPCPVVLTLVDDINAAWPNAGCLAEAPLLAALRAAAAEPRLLTDGQRGAERDCYARHVLYSDPTGRFTIVSIVWGAGQFSPIHGHHTWCAYAVHRNTLQETLYSWDDARRAARPISTAIRTPGYSCFAHSGLDQIHKLGNCGPEPAISVHVYGVEPARVATHVNAIVPVAQNV